MQVNPVDSKPTAGANANWNKAVSRAVDNQPGDNGLGPDTRRPSGDFRSAQQIIDDNPLLKNLGNQSGVKDKLRERVGDFEHDPDAAYRASRVLEHIEKLDENGKPTVKRAELMTLAMGVSTGSPKAAMPATGQRPGACRTLANTAGTRSRANCRNPSRKRRPRVTHRPTTCHCQAKAGRWAIPAAHNRSSMTTRC